MSTESPTPAGAIMAAEIAEQPHTLTALFEAWHEGPPPAAESLLPAFRGMHHLLVTGCGSSLHAAEGTAHALITLAGIGAVARPAHELIDLSPALWRSSEGVVLFGQSGETHDTLEALRLAEAHSCPSLAITATPKSTLATESRWALDTHAGKERAIPSTKGFVGQWATGLLLALALAEAKRPAYAPYGAQHRHDAHNDALLALPKTLEALAATAALAPAIGHASVRLAHARHVEFIGSGAAAVAALEGALKLKESALLPAHASTPGELKHGPFAMLEPEDAVVLLMPPALPEPLHERLATLLARLVTLGVQLVCVAEPDAWQATLKAAGHRAAVVYVPGCTSALVWPLVATTVLQRLALETARLRNIDPDRPRRLVKSIQDHLPAAVEGQPSP